MDNWVVVFQIFLEVSTLFPIGSMYGIFTYIWLIFMVNVGKYTIHGSFGFGEDAPILTFAYFFRWVRKQPPTR